MVLVLLALGLATGSVVFVGDSILANWAAAPGEFFLGELYVDRGVRFRGDVVTPGTSVVLIQGGAAQARHPNPRILAINAALATFARERHHALADFHAVVVAPDGRMSSTLYDDGLQPNAAGYAAMAPVAKAAIGAAMR